MVAVADLLVGLDVEDGVVLLGEALGLGLGAGLTTGAEMVPVDPGSPEHPARSRPAATPEAAATTAKVRPGALRRGCTGGRGIPHCA